ncbi:MAG: glycosyltransferase family 2 protein [Candidatus Abyssobacteria bacterium SURF_17]|jgi:cellulose synthase/poly-beta-1,6-N-acetylglucosamine synthase-like glycosyltransferase|uniref:Glycosyltransferase family 2 protein n=1 Tax=Candidatus Abyssobacteria bacterium SURF_17 TaxID=2093361 RepID=A0A419F2B7_9BACT|nr:MAG: glycosyltransferase family 2 protein [Candidatus Abyssubacteria bacterium SURF_17]
MSASETILLLLVATVFYVYVGYPALLWMLSRLRRRPVRKAAYYPCVTIIISAHNEAAAIRQTIENKLELDYPREQMEIIVVSDGSTDGTDEIVRTLAQSGVHLIRQEPRQGKTAALNRAVTEAKGEILAFSDANSLWDKSALRELVSNFADPDVGYVSGRMEYTAPMDSHVAGGSSRYMRYENRLRELESAIGSIVGVDGGIDAVRRTLYEPMHPSLLPDLVLPLCVVEKRRRVVYEPSAILNEESLTRTDEEYRMRIRVALRAFHALWHKKALFNPFRFGFYSLQLLSHKVLRYLVGYIMVAILFCSIAIQEPWSLAFAGLQGLGYGLALVGLWQNRSNRVQRGFRYPFYFCLINLASAVAFLKFLMGQRLVVWNPRRGEESS